LHENPCDSRSADLHKFISQARLNKFWVFTLKIVRFIRLSGRTMQLFRIALANLRPPETAGQSVDLAVDAVACAGRLGARIVCCPDCFVPGFRWPGTEISEPDPDFLAGAIIQVAEAAKRANIGVILGTERIAERGLQITACVINPDGNIAGWQDKTQLDPDEEEIYPAYGEARYIFHIGGADLALSFVMKGGVIPRPYAGQQGAVRRSISIHLQMRQHVQTIVPHSSVTPPTVFTKRRSCAEQRKMAVISPRCPARFTAKAQPLRWLDRTGN